jgi:hypothetical protein
MGIKEQVEERKTFIQATEKMLEDAESKNQPVLQWVVDELEAAITFVNDNPIEEPISIEPGPIDPAILQQYEIIQKGTQNRNCCQEILDLISGYNASRNLSLERIQSMITTFATAKTFLNENMPASAKVAIAAIQPDGELVTEELKQMVLETFVRYGI